MNQKLKVLIGQMMDHYLQHQSIWIWDKNDDDDYECASFITQHTQDVKKVKWHPHENILASSSYDNTVKLFMEDPTGVDWICTTTLSSHTSTVWSLSFDKTGKYLVTCSDDKTIKIWQEYKNNNNELNWNCLTTINGDHDGPIYDVDWCKNTGLIVTACGDNNIRIYKDIDCHNFNLICCEINAHKLDVNSVCWNPNESGLLASAGDDGNIKIWRYYD
ncbi:probable cytosolic iron-sulfur protein assembly protein Ciao1 [Aphidius gifuensis]|uniref:probable cytosolic iron-sulfur protein assembly protein Ciao1 n=1 Tax=Aphidius gifuensis TaxID=684658 RepID=UPI001CDC8D86|nr:probable cytosolic iron-sulfur protein assembly protein Ciao1 [Aphidius gifuensis]XP_044015398.1 probable cytosolic iron-sulfur protein assembly protein Ciao1 [Aphidius gifuensis]